MVSIWPPRGRPITSNFGSLGFVKLVINEPPPPPLWLSTCKRQVSAMQRAGSSQVHRVELDCRVDSFRSDLGLSSLAFTEPG